MEIIDSLKWRYATKKFDENLLLSEEKIETLKRAFNLTATSYGLQPLKLLILQDKKIQKELVPFSMDQEQVAQASHVLIFCIETKIDEEYIKTYFDRVEAIRKTPEEILKPFEDYLIEDFGKQTEAEIHLWATKQAYLAMGNLLTVLAMEKIDSCPMEGFDPEAYDKHLNLAERDLKSVLVMPIGYRAVDDMHSDFKKVRKNLDEVIIHL